MTDSPSTIFLLGLAGSGKTHFLVALDVILDNQSDSDGLVHADLAADRAYLQPLKEAWLRGEELERTSGSAPAPPHLLLVRHPATDTVAEFSIPDLAGESFGFHFESRSLPKELGDRLQQAAGLIVFVHSEQSADHEIMEHPSFIDTDDQSTAATRPEIADWTIEHASRQTQLVDLLQFVAKLNPIKAPLPVAVVISAWDVVDKVPETDRSHIPNDPSKFLVKFWPLLSQYLANNDHKYNYRVYGVSARGGGTSSAEVIRLTAISRPSDRILIVDDKNRSKDLTRPIRWILGLNDFSSA